MGITVAVKRLYKKKFLKEIMVITKNGNEVENSTRGHLMMQNLCANNIRQSKSVICSPEAVWNEMKSTTLPKSWKQLLSGIKVKSILRVSKHPISTKTTLKPGENVSENDIEQ